MEGSIMASKKILYISSSLGLGHITRDLAIAKELRILKPELEISWLAAHPASLLLKEAGERLLPEADQYANDNIPAENAAKGTHLNLLSYLTKASKEWEKNVSVFDQVTSKEQYDLIIGDEAYEIVVGIQKKPSLKRSPFVMIYDFIGLDTMTNNPLEWLGTYIWNRIWSKDFKQGRSPIFDLALFVGEEEDVPDKKFGFMLPNRRDWAKTLCKFVGYIFPFNPKEYADKNKIRTKLNYGDEPFFLCSIGGTSIGKELLILCGQAYPIIREEVPDLHMLLVCGPRLAADSLKVPEGVEVRGYVPDLYEHFAASDLAIVQGGATSTLELTALNRPFLFFPVEGHFEQARVAERLTRHKAGVKMSYSQTTPESLAEMVISNLGKEVSYPPIATDGAQNAAQHICQLL